MTTYNGEKYLKEQLDSIINQTYKNIEIIVQDDCSTDKTIDILNQYKKHITIYKNNTNLGYIKNFETLIQKTNGNFIALCDQDDIWEKDKIEILLDNIKGYSLIYSNSLLVDEYGNSRHKTLKDKLKNNFINSNEPLNFLFDNCVSAHSMLFQKELLPYLKKLPTHLYFDQYIAIVASSLNGVKFINKNLVKYRQHSNNTLGNKKKNNISLISKINIKLEKKTSANQLMLNSLEEFITINTLSIEDAKKLKLLIQIHKEFYKSNFNFFAFKFYLRNRNIFFKITTKNKFILSIKKAIGYNLYKILPIL